VLTPGISKEEIHKVANLPACANPCRATRRSTSKIFRISLVQFFGHLFFGTSAARVHGMSRLGSTCSVCVGKHYCSRRSRGPSALPHWGPEHTWPPAIAGCGRPSTPRRPLIGTQLKYPLFLHVAHPQEIAGGLSWGRQWTRTKIRIIDGIVNPIALTLKPWM